MCSSLSTGLYTNLLEVGYLFNKIAGRTGRWVKFPPQLGQTLRSTLSAQDLQNVHSKEQIMASTASKAKGFLQFSQFGRISNIYKF